MEKREGEEPLSLIFVHIGRLMPLEIVENPAIIYSLGTYTQCCREILFLLNRLFRDISRNEDLIAIFISRYILSIYN